MNATKAHDSMRAIADSTMNARAMLDISADNGVGNTVESDDDEEEGVYDDERSQHLSTEKGLPVNPRAIL